MNRHIFVIIMTKLRKPRQKSRKLPERKERPSPKGLLRRRDSTGRTIQKRLQELQQEEDLTLDTFAAKVGASKPSTSRTWLAGKSLPSVEYLDSIATSFNVTTDWLLGITGAPKYRSQRCTSTALEQELAGYLARKVANRVMTSFPNVTTDALQVDVAGLLEDTVTRESDGLQKWASWFTTLGKARAAMEKVERMLMDSAEDKFPDTFRETDLEHLQQLVRDLEQVPPTPGLFVKFDPTSVSHSAI